MKRSAQILIVEDEVVIGDAIKQALVREGFEVIGPARSYDEALCLTRKTALNLAIIDVGLGEGLRDGVTTAEALLNQQWFPIIYLTGKDDDSTFKRAKATNPQAFMCKPFIERELVRQVDLVLYNVDQGTLNAKTGYYERVYWPIEQGYARIEPADVYFLAGNGNYTNVYLTTEATQRLQPDKPDQLLMLTGNLGHWGNGLPPSSFYRLNKSYIINLTYIDLIEPHQIRLGTHQIPITSAMHKQLVNRLRVVGTR